MRRLTFAALVAALSLVALPAFAQDGADAPEEKAPADAEAEAATDDGADEDGAATEGKAAAEGESATEGEAAEGEAAEGEASKGEAAEGAEGETAEGAEGEGEPAVGPGGRPLRTDYPGTEESLKANMETNKIEGFEVDPNMPSEAYGLRIKELETKIDDLKEKVFQSKTRIVLLRETLLSGNVGGSRAIIIHRTDLGPAFKLRQAIYALDGTRIFSEVDKDGSLADKTTFEVFDGNISPGNHNLSVYLRYQGSGYGVFKYFDGYDFEMRNSCVVPGKEGKLAVVTSKAVTKGNVTTSAEDKPTLECTVSYRDNTNAPGTGGDEEKDSEATSEE